MDTHNLSELWISHRRLLAERTLYGGNTVALGLLTALHNYNAMVLEKLWAPMQENHLDRERVVMTNVCQAVELCLKAVKTHAAYRECGTFWFDGDHDVKGTYDSLPETLKQAILTASRSFVKLYTAFRKAVEEDMKRLKSGCAGNWEVVGNRVDSNTYTAILGANDPPVISDGWFEEAIRLMHTHNSTYHRYSPKHGFDEYPVEPIHSGLILGRFLYEHLFPIHAVEQHKPIRKFTAVNGVVLDQCPGAALPRGLAEAYFPGRWI